MSSRTSTSPRSSALHLRRRVLGAEHPCTLVSAGNLAGVLRNLANFAEAAAIQRETLESRRRVLGSEHLEKIHWTWQGGFMQ